MFGLLVTPIRLQNMVAILSNVFMPILVADLRSACASLISRFDQYVRRIMTLSRCDGDSEFTFIKLPQFIGLRFLNLIVIVSDR